jgi:hypothetical protein
MTPSGRTKRVRQDTRSTRAISRELRHAQRLLQDTDTPGGLAELDRIAGACTDPRDRARVVALAADDLRRRRRWADALDAYRRAARLGMEHAAVWTRARLGEIETLLEAQQPEPALEQAHLLLDDLLARSRAHDRLVAALPQSPLPAALPEPPPPAVRIAVRLARLFLRFGEWTAAQALAGRFPGATRADHKLLCAQLALYRGDFADASTQAELAVSSRKSSADVLEGWTLLCTARAKQGLTGLEPRHRDWLALAASSVRARAVIAIARALRGAGDDAWLQFVGEWLAAEGSDFPAAAAEALKLMLSDLTTDGGDPARRAAVARLLLQTPRIRPKEFLFAVRHLVRGLVAMDRPIPVDEILAGASRQFGPDRQAEVRHTLSLALDEAGRGEEAEKLWRAAIGDLAPDDPFRGRALWRLAERAVAQKRWSDAARDFLRYVETPAMPARLRDLALLRFAGAATQAGDRELFEQGRSRIADAIRVVQDPGALYQLAWTLAALGPALGELAAAALEQAERRLDAWLAGDRDPAALAAALRIQAARLLPMDEHARVVRRWEGLTERQRDNLWGTNLAFWEYVALVSEAYRDCGRHAEGDRLAQRFVDDPGAPPEGRARVAIATGDSLLARDCVREGLAWLARAEGDAPFHPDAARLYYWRAVEARVRGDAANARHYADQMRRALGERPGLVRERVLLARATVLRHDLNEEAAARALPPDLAGAVRSTRLQIEADAARLKAASLPL